MSILRRNRTIRAVVQAAKWILVAWLLYPLRGRIRLPIDFTRSALGLSLIHI